MADDDDIEFLEPRGPSRPRRKEDRNFVSDTIVGVNTRWQDNLFQAVFMLVTVLIGAGVGALVAPRTVEGPILGGVAGLLIGLFLSGFILMIFRGVQHLRSKRD